MCNSALQVFSDLFLNKFYEDKTGNKNKWGRGHNT